MNVFVLLRMVPDVVEGLDIAPGQTTLEPETVRLILSESDNHALEQALLLKESRGVTVTVMALDSPDVEGTLFTALAKGADRAIRIFPPGKWSGTRQMVSIFARVIESEPELKAAALILTGVRTITDLDAPLAPLLARRLGLPHLGIVSKMWLDYLGRSITAMREYPDGVRGEFEIRLPAVLSIQAAEKPPRYVQVARVLAAEQTRTIECLHCPALGESWAPPLQVVEMRKPRVRPHAEMLAGPHDVVAGRLRDVLVSLGLVEGA